MTTQRGGPSPAPASPVAAASPRPELPWAFIDCPADTLVVLIAHMLELLCQHNDQVLLTPDALTRFHSRAPPGITIIDYLRRIVKYTNLEVGIGHALAVRCGAPRRTAPLDSPGRVHWNLHAKRVLRGWR
jgi:hypothetical protein